MPVIPPSTFPKFFTTVVLKREGLLKDSNLDAIPKVVKRHLRSSWVRDSVFSGKLETCRLGIQMISFLPKKDPIIVFNQTHKRVFTFIHSVSQGEYYLEQLSSKGVSIYPTCTLSQFTAYVMAQPSKNYNELKLLAKQFQIHNAMPQRPNEIIRQDLSNKFKTIEKTYNFSFDLKFKNEFLKISEKVHNVRDVEAWRKEIFSRVDDAAKKLIKTNVAIVNTATYKKTIKAVKQITSLPNKIKTISVEKTSKKIISTGKTKTKNFIKII